MHEMPVTQAMLNMALQHADGQRIADIYLQVGKMSAIVPESVEVFFDYLSEGTLAEGATLHFERVPIEMSCLDCGQQADLSQWADESPQSIMMKALHRGCECGSKKLRVTGGVGFEMTSLNVESASSEHERIMQ